MSTRTAQKRLTKEYLTIQASPTPYIEAHPSESNILEWYYVITGPPDSPYAGGEYMGTLVFPADYPFQPPAIRMTTPSGRFKTSTRLCLSISDYHPKTWNPAWSVSTILVGLLSFMVSEEATTGSLMSSTKVREDYAAKSHSWNRSLDKFREEFPHLVARPRTIEEAGGNADLSRMQKDLPAEAMQPAALPTEQEAPAAPTVREPRPAPAAPRQSNLYLWAAVALCLGAVVWVAQN